MTKLRTIIVISVLLLSLMSSTIARADEQINERLIYNGDTVSISVLPLYPVRDFVETVLKEKERRELSRPMNLLRGYLGTWEICDGKLYLVKLDVPIYHNNYKSINLFDIFGDKCVEGRVLADWYSGNFIIPTGNLTRSFLGFFRIHRTYSTEDHVLVKEGYLIKTQHIKNYISVPGAIPRLYSTDDDQINYIGEKRVFQAIIDSFNRHPQILKKELQPTELDAIKVVIGPKGTVIDVSSRSPKSKFYKSNRPLKRLLKDLRFDIVKFWGKKYSEQIVLLYEYDGNTLYPKDELRSPSFSRSSTPTAGTRRLIEKAVQKR
ncbi:MAG: hypothetical protein J6Y78_16280 [Paludibacteraceae bacterium]|nr:hypothetical protein [Paludibacteraceae bacterium]